MIKKTTKTPRTRRNTKKNSVKLCVLRASVVNFLVVYETSCYESILRIEILKVCRVKTVKYQQLSVLSL